LVVAAVAQEAGRVQVLETAELGVMEAILRSARHCLPPTEGLVVQEMVLVLAVGQEAVPRWVQVLSDWL